tara:strand:+ start:580 stop:777 length:198 start_codon:yes stop_codon:yes gene_type:complete
MDVYDLVYKYWFDEEDNQLDGTIADCLTMVGKEYGVEAIRPALEYMADNLALDLGPYQLPIYRTW